MTSKAGPGGIREATRPAARSVRAWILTLPRGAKQSLMIVTDVVFCCVAVTAAIWTVYGSADVIRAWWIIFIAGVAVPIFSAFGLYASIIRYMGYELFRTALLSTLLVASALALIGYWSNTIDAPLRAGVIFWALSLILVTGARFLARVFLSRRNQFREPVIVYGAGDAGSQLIGALLGGDAYLPVAIVDDNLDTHGKRVKGLRVRAPGHLSELVERTGATSVLLAIPSASRYRRRKVLEMISEFPVRVQTMPGINDIVSGRARVDDLADVDVKDLLGRDPIPPISRLLAGSITGRSVMVTGAGGSIGSELCRQILSLNPLRLVCLERSEAALYEIERELARMAERENSRCEIVALLGSTNDEIRAREALELMEVQTVYHAAAYKHVPIVEHNIFEGIRNNVFGTWHMARAAEQTGVESFVLISTDKAVNPTSVMGATKRMSELALQALNQEADNMRVCMVRFGNVLESSGSVVPLFKEQIRGGGPVTVTHRDIIRYFMTIPEAAQLVIQAGAMARGGDVFVLDMGEPVRIEDLARRMINLMGLTVRDRSNPEGDIAIEYIGLRPAEKLYEELLIGSNVSGTDHPRIMRADEDFLPLELMSELLDELNNAVASYDYGAARNLLMRAVGEYQPTNGIEDHLWLRRTGTAEDDDKIVEFPRP